MTTHTHTPTSAGALFDQRINRWGRLTIGLGLLISLAGPIYLFTVEGLFPGWAVIGTSLFAITTIFAVNWIVEPATYFPMLGVAGTYQAWLVGNISNKLLPAAITAQVATDAKPGTRKAELVSIAAISGAVIIHVTSLVLFVAVLGTWIVSILPERVEIAFGYILPAILGAVLVQLLMALRDWFTTGIALLLGGLVVFGLLALVPGAAAFALPIVVVGTVTAAILRGRAKHRRASTDSSQ
ncbi:hypothetical protein [Leucobacter sp. M11]|uniref:hypothetical protein n=1 Tax=Leucobacter sp. M11 TaxID=2993565 RepID=UPI002D7FFEEB|nr:hypothetical protein [Leucobacter sp. M11]MEB4615864.1 hypothetical protein [Leucobacter sp. M11]